ncbi:hypothetical protein, partial [Roseomonas marmotae]|uniref:hypothetical protein n=1 Tax=Roseomonas marmotae TaxID=2768161 RepID=UPI001A969D1C
PSQGFQFPTFGLTQPNRHRRFAHRGSPYDYLHDRRNFAIRILEQFPFALAHFNCSRLLFL